MKRLLVIAPLALVLAGCAATPATTPTPLVETIEPAPTSAAPVAPETPVADPGTRSSPLAVGEKIRISAESMWTVGASAATQVGPGYVALPLHLEMDWDVAASQGMQDGDGIDPNLSLWIEYVTAGGRSYDDAERYIDLPNQLYQVGTVYPPASTIDANYVVTIPDAEIAGGTWKVANSKGDGVFIVGG